MADKAAGGDRPDANLPFPQRNVSLFSVSFDFIGLNLRLMQD